MSSNKTPNYNLHAWEPGDHFLRSEFNENFSAIDAALHDGLTTEAAARKKALSAESEARHAEIEAKIVTGSYTGDGAAERFISLGATPKAVLLLSDGSICYISGSGYYGGLAVGSAGSPGVSICDGGFTVRSDGRALFTNTADTVYPYLAVM